MVHELKCSATKSCREPVQHTKLVAGRGLDYCSRHVRIFMRCESNNVDMDGACHWCDAVQGESCKRK